MTKDNCGGCNPPKYCNRRNQCVLWEQLCNEDNCQGRCVNGRCDSRSRTIRPPIRPRQGVCDPNQCRPPHFCNGNVCSRGPPPPPPQGCGGRACPGGRCFNGVCYHPHPPHQDVFGGSLNPGGFLTGPPFGFEQYAYDDASLEQGNHYDDDDDDDDDIVSDHVVHNRCDGNRLCPFPQNCIRGICHDIACDPRYGRSYCPHFARCSAQRICVRDYNQQESRYNHRIRCNALNCAPPARCINNICRIVQASGAAINDRQAEETNQLEQENHDKHPTTDDVDKTNVVKKNDDDDFEEQDPFIDYGENEKAKEDVVKPVIECNSVTCPPPAECVRNVCQRDGYYQPFKVPSPSDKVDEEHDYHQDACNSANCPAHKRCINNRCSHIVCAPDLNLFTCPTFSVCSRDNVCVRDPNYQGEPVHPVRCDRSNCPPPGVCNSNNECVTNANNNPGPPDLGTFECNPNLSNPCLPGEHCVDGKCYRFHVDPLPPHLMEPPNREYPQVQRQRHGTGAVAQVGHRTCHKGKGKCSQKTSQPAKKQNEHPTRQPVPQPKPNQQQGQEQPQPKVNTPLPRPVLPRPPNVPFHVPQQHFFHGHHGFANARPAFYGPPLPPPPPAFPFRGPVIRPVIQQGFYGKK